MCSHVGSRSLGPVPPLLHSTASGLPGWRWEVQSGFHLLCDDVILPKKSGCVYSKYCVYFSHVQTAGILSISGAIALLGRGS